MNIKPLSGYILIFILSVGYKKNVTLEHKKSGYKITLHLKTDRKQ